jgi:hypothetical protein
MNWPLLFPLLARGLEHVASERHLLVTSGLAILSLAAWMGRATGAPSHALSLTADP